MKSKSAINGNFEDFLDRAFSSLDYEGYKEHPSQQMLLDYVYEQTDVHTLSRISAHVATCRECSERVRALRSELDKTDKALARYLQGYSPREAEKGVQGERSSRRIQGVFQKVLGNTLLSNRKAFYGHLTAWATATSVIAFLLLRYLQQPVVVLESSNTPTTGAFVKLLYVIISALGLWGMTGLAFHGYKALRRGGGREGGNGDEGG